MVIKNNLFVTVGVLAYNSAATILDTLESIAAQTYKNIELIVCDDGSKDNTAEMVRTWLATNKDLFVRVELVTVEKNTGTPANCNRLLRAAKGEWLKMIAADDILLPQCIEDFVDYVCRTPNAKVVYSNYNSFIKGDDGLIKITGAKISEKVKDLFDVDAHTQLYTYIEHGFNISPAVFMNLEFARSIGFIEKYKVFEDSPFYVRVLQGGTKIYHLDKDTVLYRSDGDSVTREKDSTHFFKRTFFDNILLFRRDVIYSLYPWYRISFWIKEFSFLSVYYFTVYVLRNRRTRFTQIVYNCFKALNPYYLIQYIFQRIC